jgi:hypothetical protein
MYFTYQLICLPLVVWLHVRNVDFKVQVHVDVFCVAFCDVRFHTLENMTCYVESELSRDLPLASHDVSLQLRLFLVPFVTVSELTYLSQ